MPSGHLTHLWSCTCSSIPHALTHLGRWRVFFALALLGPVIAWLVAAVRMIARGAPVDMKLGPGSDPRWSSDPTAWGGHARSPLALAFGIAEVLACAFGVWPIVVTWAYSLIAGSHISCIATEHLVEKMETANKASDDEGPLTEEQIKTIGVEVQILHEEVLRVLSEAWGPSISATVVLCAAAAVLSVRG